MVATVGAAISVIVVLTACGTDSSSSASARCELLPDAARAHLADALVAGQMGSAFAVRSTDFEHVYMVAALVDGEPALWAMNDIVSGGGLIFSLNDHAYEVSHMGSGADISSNDDGAREALSCLQ